MARIDQIAAANPNAKANKEFLDALFLELRGTPATPQEKIDFGNQSVRDASNNILGQGRSPFRDDPSQPLIDEVKKRDSFAPFEFDEDLQRETAQREFQDYFLGQRGELNKRLGTEESRLGQDLATLLGELGQEQKFAGQDLATALEGFGRQREQTTSDFGQQLQQSLGQQTAQAGQSGLFENFGGFEANKDFITQQNQQGMSRALESYGLQEEASQRAYDRALADIQSRRKQGRRANKRGLYDIGEERRLGIDELREQRETGIQDKLTEERRAERGLYEERRDDYYNYQ